jgi:hypothetical protein
MGLGSTALRRPFFRLESQKGQWLAHGRFGSCGVFGLVQPNVVVRFVLLMFVWSSVVSFSSPLLSDEEEANAKSSPSYGVPR